MTRSSAFRAPPAVGGPESGECVSEAGSQSRFWLLVIPDTFCLGRNGHRIVTSFRVWGFRSQGWPVQQQNYSVGMVLGFAWVRHVHQACISNIRDSNSTSLAPVHLPFVLLSRVCAWCRPRLCQFLQARGIEWFRKGWASSGRVIAHLVHRKNRKLPLQSRGASLMSTSH